MSKQTVVVYKCDGPTCLNTVEEKGLYHGWYTVSFYHNSKSVSRDYCSMMCLRRFEEELNVTELMQELK